MLVLDHDDSEIEIRVGGQYRDDIQIESAYYLDRDCEVSQFTLDYIQKRYASDIYQEWLEQQVDRAEYYHDNER